jgi:bacterioferritin (cytochrome b1)
MQKIEINTPEPEKVLPVLRDAIERQKRILSQSLAQTEERIQQLSKQLEPLSYGSFKLTMTCNSALQG